MEYTFYVSGVGRIPEIRALNEIGVGYGISMDTLTKPLLNYMLSNPKGNIFVDSGAFAEVEFTEKGRSIKKELTHKDWIKILDTYQVLAHAFKKRALFVAPDSVGSQSETIVRLKRYKDLLLPLIKTSSIIVPLQKGRLNICSFYREVCDLLETEDFICGLPFKKSALDISDFIELMEEINPKRVHFLGVSPRSPKFPYIREVTKSLKDPPIISLDAVLLRALVGREKKLRPLTEAQDLFREEGWSPSECRYLAIKHIKKEILREESKIVSLERFKSLDLFSNEMLNFSDEGELKDEE